MSLRGSLRSLSAGLREYYEAPYRRTLSRARGLAARDAVHGRALQAEALGVPNPASYYTVELLPLLSERVHEWHTRLGLERSPLDGVACC
jgi:hypothetical protein